MKKIFAILLSLIMSLNFLSCISFADGDFSDIEVFNISDSDDRYEQKLSENGSGKGWIWDSASKTLTLNGITDGSFGSYNIKESSGPITIVLADGSVNTFKGSLFLNCCDYIIKGEGELIIEPEIGVLYDDNGEYLTDEEGLGVHGEVPNHMSWNTTVTMESGTITGKMRGVYLQGRLILNGGNLNLEGGIYGGLGESITTAVITGGKLTVSLPDFKHLDKYISAISAAQFYKSNSDSPMICGLEASPATGKNGEALVWKSFESKDGMTEIGLFDQNGNPATYAEFAPADCYTKTGEKADNWVLEAVEKAIGYGIAPQDRSFEFLSDTNQSADLTVNITRAEFAAVVVSLYEKVTGTEMATTANPFADVIYGNDEYVVSKAYNAGLINGISDTEFAPDANLTREQASTILYRVYEKLGKAIDASGEAFADDGLISPWAKSAVYAMAGKGILNGVGDNMFSPQSNAQKQQALAIAVRMYEDLTE